MRLPALLLLAACARRDLRRFPDAPPLTEDPDRHPFAPPPEPYWSGIAWDGIDQTLFRPTFRYLSLDLAGPAVNVNAMDEVPDSSWYTNRPGITPAEAARGACPDELLDPAGPWTVTAAKPNGANPGFIIRGPAGRGWLVKFDGLEQPERATAADVIGSRLYHAAGYWAPCNIIVAFDPSILRMDPEARGQDAIGRDRPLQQEDVDRVLAAAVRLPDGRLRASASLFLPGRPLGPWTYQDTRPDDPNDVVPHEDRRELRGARLLAAWINHFDAREQNTLSVWIEAGPEGDGRGWVRHYYLDFGDSLGSLWEEQGDAFSRRFGYSYYFDVGDVLADYLTLGTIRRPWEELEPSRVAPMLGYFDAEHFDPRTWKPGYPNPAFVHMREEDGAWMARVLAGITEAHLEAIVGEAHFSDPAHAREVLRILVERRRRILAAYLVARSPLTRPRVEDDRLCLDDLAAETGIAEVVAYEARAWTPPFRHPVRLEHGATPCAELAPLARRLPRRDPYLVVDLVVRTADGPLPPARVHLVHDEGSGFRVVGLERPPDARPPAARR